MGKSKKEKGAVLDADLALAQAANTLVAATEKAEFLNDTEALMKIAGGWMEIHEYLTGTPHHGGPRKNPLGFAASIAHEEEELEEELDDAVAAEGKSSRRIYAQYGEFRVPKGRYRR